MKIPKVLVANGVNLDLLGRRQPDIYGHQTLGDLEHILRQRGPELAKLAGFSGVDLHFIQTNVEAEYLQALSEPWDGALVNPGAWTHTSLALGDRLKGLGLKFVEVHISATANREAFRHHSYLSASALGTVSGLGFHSYVAALLGLLEHLSLEG